MATPVSVDDIRAAHARIKAAVKRTPCERATSLSDELSGDVALKLENQQVTGSFKARGAGNKLLSLTADERARGVICASAGNHAQGVAYWAQRLGVAATIVMPVGTPLIKVARTQGYGAVVKLYGENYDDAFEEAQRIAREQGQLYVHAYDDAAIVAGQGTIGLEILEQQPDVDTVVVPVGGGGLIGGIAIAIKAHKPSVRVVGVEVTALPSMKRALEVGHPVSLPAARTLAEGIAIRKVGAINVEICKQVVDEIVTVDDAEIARAILALLEREKTVVEGAGAAGVAALLAGRVDVKGKHTVALVCGGNIDVSLLSRIIDRGLVESGRLARFSVAVPDRPGALAELLSIVAKTRGNVLEVHHERAFLQGDLGQVGIQVVVETRGHDHVAELRHALAERGMMVR